MKLRTIGSAVGGARSGRTGVVDRHGGCHITLDVASRKPSFTGEYDGDRGKRTTSGDDRADVRALHGSVQLPMWEKKVYLSTMRTL